MNTSIGNKNLNKQPESSASDILDNQVNTFHVEQKELNNKELGKADNLKYNTRKFKITTINSIEFFFAPSGEKAKEMFFQAYPCGMLCSLEEVTVIN